LIGASEKVNDTFHYNNDALIGASEKVNDTFHYNNDYTQICKMADRGQIPPCTIDGPLDVFLACDKESVKIKGIPTPINGDWWWRISRTNTRHNKTSSGDVA